MNINLSNKNLTKLPSNLPESLKENFTCEYNNLTNLIGAPKKVTGFFNCSNNNLTSLEGAPDYVGGVFNCYGNNLKISDIIIYLLTAYVNEIICDYDERFLNKLNNEKITERGLN